ncbi:chloride channel protein [Streptomyces sp. NPDC057217]|uniref:chloride channel protein n=1 Tax=Streptomyces sp. NPDC057217 TaxID=3346054 RepID=UPI00362B3340
MGHRLRRAKLGPWYAAEAREACPTAVEFLVEREVAALGGDGNNNTAPSPMRDIAFPVHVLAIHAPEPRPGPATPESTALLGAAGAAAAIVAVLLIEVAGVGGPQLFLVMLPALLPSGVGVVLFTGFGRWTGLETGHLSVRFSTAPPRLNTGDVAWSILLAMGIGALTHLVVIGGRLTAAFVAASPFVRTVICAVAAGGYAALYAVVTGRTPVDVASSGQATLAGLAADPHAWSVGALLAVLLFKSAAYALCLGSLRGGPVFPVLFLGAAAGVLLSPLPGFGVIPVAVAGMAAAAMAVLRLPVSSVALVVLVLGNSETIPVVILAAVTSFVTAELLPRGPSDTPRRPREKPRAAG